MARKDLAGLAALGALGMMLNRKKKAAEQSGMDAEMADRANAVSRGRTDLVDTGMSTPEPGGRVRPDENYGNEGRRTGPVGVGKVPVRSRPRLDTSGVTDMDLTGGAESPDQTGGRGVGSLGSLATKTMQGYGGRRFHPEYPEDVSAGMARDRAMNEKLGAFDQGPANSTYKKGGAVKKMASGGTASSASKRADGIATKGKTRGKMC
jgi:hypothetical protein